MVRVNNVESVESKSITSHKPENGGASAEAMKLMDKAQLPSAGKRSEPDQIVFNSSIYDCQRPGNKHVITPGERDFRPDPTLSSRGAREWQEKHKEQSKKPMELNKDGKYEVQPGDSFSSIAKRDLKRDGKEPSQADIEKRSKELQELNKDSTSNGHYLKPGMTLRMKPDEAECKRKPEAGGDQDKTPGTTSESPAVRRGTRPSWGAASGGEGGSGNGNGVSGRAPESGAGSADTRPAEGIRNIPGYKRPELPAEIPGNQRPTEPRGLRTRPQSGLSNAAPESGSNYLTDGKQDGNLDRYLAQPI